MGQKTVSNVGIHPPDGPTDAKILVLGERPGYEEHRAFEQGYDTVNFIGPAGEELWERLNRIALIQRDDCRVMNLVPTFSTKPPSKSEIALHGWRVLREIKRVRPELILTVGYHAARFLLPQYEGVNGDYFHGLAHRTCVGRLRPVDVTVIPLVHSSAALRQPGKFQLQLTQDIGAVRDVRRGSAAIHELHDLAVYRSGLASLESRELTGFDTEFAGREVQALTFSRAVPLSGLYEAYLAEPPLLPHVRAFLETAPLVAHSASAEYHSLVHLGIDRWDRAIDDTMIMAYVLGRPHLGLKALAARELKLRMHSYEDVVGPVDDLRVREFLDVLRERLSRTAAKVPSKGPMPEKVKRARRALTSITKLLEVDHEDKTRRQRYENSVLSDRHPLPQPASWKDAEQSVREPYAMGDAVACRLLRDHLWPQVESEGLSRAYCLQRDVLPLLVRNETVGLLVDGQTLRDLSTQFAADFVRVCGQINHLAGHVVNPLSGDQVSETLFHELGIRPTRLTKSQKAHTTADKYLKARRKEHDIIPLILEARLLNKYKSTYTDKLPDMLDENSRFHPEWIDCGTATGRLAEKILLLIPKHTPRATLIRNCFHADTDNSLVSVDLSQIELRMMAHLSRDSTMLAVFERGDDMHADTAHHLLGAPKGKENQDESLHRLPAKTMNFGIINGMTEYGILDQLHEAGQLQWDLDQVKEFRSNWFRVYSGVDRFWQQQIALGRHYGYVVTMFGRKRYLHGLRSTSPQVRAEAERQALCSIQSSADDVSKLWNIRLWRRVIRPMHRESIYCEPWIRVHDDTTLEVRSDHASRIGARMLELVPQLLDIPTTAEAKGGSQWGDLHKLPKSKGRAS